MTLYRFFQQTVAQMKEPAAKYRILIHPSDYKQLKDECDTQGIKIPWAISLSSSCKPGSLVVSIEP